LRVRVHIFVSGQVQGVFFRHETRKVAYRHSVTGWVQNLRDGRVEAVFEGESRNVEAMITFCQKGPPGAFVRNVEILWEEPTGEFRDFLVRY